MQKAIKDSIILIVEDNQTQQNIMQVFLKNYGFNFISAFNGVEAFKILESILPDLILLDIMLPGMDGFEICTKLKENPRTRDIPVIFITALRNESDIVKGLKLGGSDYLGKPFNQEELVARVKNHLNLKIYQDQVNEQNLKLQEEILKYEKYKNELIISDEKYRKAFQLNPNPSVIAKIKDQTYLEVNNAFLNFFGYSKEEIIGKSSEDFLFFADPNQRLILFEIFNKAGTIHNFEVKLKSKSNTIYTVLVSMERIVIHEEPCYISILTDITELVEIQNALNHSENRYKQLTENANCLIAELDADHKFLYANQGYKIFLGYNPESLKNKSFFDLIYQDDQELFKAKCKNIFEANKPLETTGRFIANDGSILWFNCSGNIADNANNPNKIVIVCVDITSRINAEEELKNSTCKLKEINNAKDKFFSIIAHDLKGPLASFNSVLNELKKSYKDITPSELESFINTLNLSTNNLFELLEDLLEWSKSQTGAIQFLPEMFSIKYLIDNVISLFIQNALNKNIELKSEVMDDILVYADVKMTSTILRNLISNAIKFTQPNGKIIIESKLTKIDKREFISVSVRDNGIGIPEEIISRLCKIDTCYTTEGTCCEKGSGLGLILVKEFTERNGGRLSIVSELNVGSVFSFTLPQSAEI